MVGRPAAAAGGGGGGLILGDRQAQARGMLGYLLGIAYGQASTHTVPAKLSTSWLQDICT
jgi:hypothetical protein